MLDAFATITDRIATILRGPRPGSDEVRALLEETATHGRAAHARAAELRSKSLDPMLSADEAQAVLSQAETAEFEARRMDVAAERLTDQLSNVALAETEADRAANFKAAKAQRDTAVARIRKEYPALARQLGDLIAEILDANRAVTAANAALPQGADPLIYAEGLARGFHLRNGRMAQMETTLGAANPGATFVPAMIAEMVIPSLSEVERPIWPPTWARDRMESRPSIERLETAEYSHLRA